MAMMTESGAASSATSAHAAQKPDRRQSPPLTKRDKKRQVMMERLSVLTDKLSRDRDSSYRDQLNRIQFDIRMAQRFDPYAPDCLSKIADLRKDQSDAQGDGINADGGRTLLDMAGPSFQDFLQAVEDATEKRDFRLADHKREYDAKLAKYNNTYLHKVQTAMTEHQYLAGTIRDRLTNHITSRKNRLNREKEALEISEASALLLHPSQFSITNPASPGGTHGKRATRMRRDADELPGFSDKKRKRNPVDEDGSPAPIRRALDPNSTTSLWQNDKIRVLAKQNGPVFSIDKLFTDKELAMTYNVAATAAHKHILKNRILSNGTDLTPEGSDSGHDGQENGDQEAEPAAAPMMERQVSHATRSTRGVNVLDEKNIGPEAMANFEIPVSLKRLYPAEPPKMPPHVAQTYMKPYPRTNDPMTTSSLSQDDIVSDMTVMNVCKQYSQSKKTGASLDGPQGLREVLEHAAVPVYATRNRDSEHGKSSNLRDKTGSSRHPTSAPTIPPGAVAIPMSRQSSFGGVAMSRQSSARGKGRRN